MGILRFAVEPYTQWGMRRMGVSWMGKRGHLRWGFLVMHGVKGAQRRVKAKPCDIGARAMKSGPTSLADGPQPCCGSREAGHESVPVCEGLEDGIAALHHHSRAHE